MTPNELKNKLYKECELTADDIFDSGQYKIITRSGIEKIQYKNNIMVNYDVIIANMDQVIIRGTFQKREDGNAIGMDGKSHPKVKTIQTFGEWNNTHTKKTKDGKVIPFYSVALAEKRCLSRGVLKIMGYYEYGFLGEDETIYDDGSLEDATPNQVAMIESLLRTSNYDEQAKEKIEREIYGLGEKQATKLIRDLQANQRDPIESGDNYNQTDIQKKLKL